MKLKYSNSLFVKLCDAALNYQLVILHNVYQLSVECKLLVLK